MLYSGVPSEPVAGQMTPTKADVAQLVEQLIRNQQVPGSSPGVGSSKLLNKVACFDLLCNGSVEASCPSLDMLDWSNRLVVTICLPWAPTRPKLISRNC